MSRHPRVVNEADLDWVDTSHAPHFGGRRKQLAAAAGGAALGCSLIELPAGRRAWPFHFHFANEEAIYVLEGAGLLRLGATEVPLRAGDYVALPAGPEHAHQTVNTTDAPLRYLVLSTMVAPDVLGYPDSAKVGVMAGAAPGGPKDQRLLQAFFRHEDAVDYWEGEDPESR